MFDHLTLETSLKSLNLKKNGSESKKSKTNSNGIVDDEKVNENGNGPIIESVEDIKDASRHIFMIRVKGKDKQSGIINQIGGDENTGGQTDSDSRILSISMFIDNQI